MNKKGFTLIELLVVVLIIGILAAIAVPQYEKSVWKTRFASVKSIVRSIKNAEEAYYLVNNDYTPDLEKLDISAPITTTNYVSAKVGSYIIGDATCSINTSDESKYIECFLFSNGVRFLAYAIYFDNDLNNPGKQHCAAFNSQDLSSVQESICMQESGLSEPTEENGNGTGYGWAY